MQYQISATELAIRAYEKLKKIDPENELLKWLDSNEITDEDFIRKFWDRENPSRNFAGPMVSMIVELNYFFAAKKELKEKYGIEI